MKITMFYDPTTEQASVFNSLNQNTQREIVKAEPNTITKAFVICHSNYHIRIVYDKEQKKVFYWVDMKVKSLNIKDNREVIFDTETNTFN